MRARDTRASSRGGFRATTRAAARREASLVMSLMTSPMTSPMLREVEAARFDRTARALYVAAVAAALRSVV